MPKLKLGMDSQKVFGEYFPSVFINKVVISYGEILPTETYASKPLQVDSTLEISFSRTADQGFPTDHFVNYGLEDTYLYTMLCPYDALNTALEESQLSLKDLYATVHTPAAEAETITSSWHGFTYILSMLKEAFINNWYDDPLTEGETDGVAWTDVHRASGVNDLNSEIAERFWGTTGDYDSPKRLNTSGPWNQGETGGFIDKWLERQLEFASDNIEAGGSPENARAKRVSLRDLMAGSSGAIVDETSFDKDGNEVTRITNININFTYSSDFFSALGEGMSSPALEQVGKLFLICFVGSDVGPSEVAHLKPNLFNANFGDISYEHILENGRVPAREENIFVEIVSEEVFNGVPIQTINKKYYTPTPIGQEQVVSSLSTLITNFTKWSEKDKRLGQYLHNLQTLLSTKAISPDLLPELALYGASYPNKDLGSPAGQFYNAFTQIVGSYDRNIAQQPQLARKLIYNDRLLDLRPAPQKNSYFAPTPDPRGLLVKNGDHFIPEVWSNMSRYAEQTIPRKGLLSDFLEFAIGERYNRSYANPLEAQTEDEWLDWVRLSALGNWEAFDESYMYEEENQQSRSWTDTVVSNKGIWYFDWTKALYTQSNLSKVINIRKLQELFHWTIPYEYYPVTVARQARTEKELELQNEPVGSLETPDLIKTASTIKMTALLCDLESIDEPGWGGAGAEHITTRGWPMYPVQMNMSYEYDTDNLKYGQPFVYSADKFAAFGKPAYVDKDQTLTVEEIEASMFNMPATYDMFLPDSTHMAYDWTYGGVGTMGPETSKVTPSVYEYIVWVDETNEENLSHRSNSYLLFQNFDVMTPNFYDRLEGYGSYDLTLDSSNFYGRGPRDGYRILSFEYRDYMDDDVAYYNTYGCFQGDRNISYANHVRTLIGAAGGSAGWGLTQPTILDGFYDVWTSYRYEVEAADRSLAFIPVLYDYCYAVFEELEEYQSRANQICSFNNIYGRFNDFFLEGIEELYGDSVKPWIRAVYVFNALRDLLYATFSQKHSGWVNYEDLMEDCRHIVNDIGPANGSLAGIEAFKERFARVLGVINPATPGARENSGYLLQRATEVLQDTDVYYVDGSGLTVDEAWSAITNQFDIHSYSNSWRIDKMIYGNLALAAYWDDAYPDFVPPSCLERGLDADVYPRVQDRMANWLACLTPEFNGNLKQWCLSMVSDAYSEGSDGGTAGTSDDEAGWSHLDIFTRGNFEWSNEFDRSMFYDEVDGVFTGGLNTGQKAQEPHEADRLGGKANEGTLVTSNRYRAWRYAIMASAFMHRWGDVLDDWSSLGVPMADGASSSNNPVPHADKPYVNSEVGPFWSKEHLRMALDDFGLGRISPYSNFEPPTPIQLNLTDYYNDDSWASSYGGRSWSEIIAIGVHYLSRWGCDRADIQPFRQEIEIQATGDGIGWYIEGSRESVGDGFHFDSRNSYSVTEQVGTSGFVGTTTYHGEVFTDVWDLINSRIYQDIYGRLEGIDEDYDPGKAGSEWWHRDRGAGVWGEPPSSSATGYVTDYDWTFAGYGVHAHAVDDYDFFCTGYVMWGYEYEDWWQGHGDWQWSEGELTQEVQDAQRAGEWHPMAFVANALGGMGHDSGPDTAPDLYFLAPSAGLYGVSTFDACWWFDTGPSAGGYYNESTGHFQVDGVQCTPY